MEQNKKNPTFGGKVLFCHFSWLNGFWNIQRAKLIKMRYSLETATGEGFIGVEDQTCSPGIMADHRKSNCSPSPFFAAPYTSCKWTISYPSCKESRQNRS